MAASAPGHAACPFGRQPPSRDRVPACKHRRHPALEPLGGELPAEGRLDCRGPAAPEGRPAPPTADLIVHPLRLSRATALPDGGVGRSLASGRRLELSENGGSKCGRKCAGG